MNFLFKKTPGEPKSVKEQLAFIENIEEFPSMPAVVLHLLSRFNDPSVTVKEIEKLINMDPGLVSYILKLTNSLMFGLMEKVYSVAKAVMLIGMSNLQSLVTSYSIRVLCNAIPNAEVQEYLWNHLLSTAVFSRTISEKVSGEKNDSSYVLGLLHDLGKIALFIHNPEKFKDALERGIEKNMDFISAEKQIFGFTHIEAGYLMVDKMQLPKEMKDVVLFHHNPEYGPSNSRMHWVVGLANELAHNTYDNKRISLDLYLEHFKFSDEELAALIRKSQIEMEQYREIF